MAPPKANADQQAIYRLMQGAQTDVTFIYPRSGDYRSAIIMRDFPPPPQRERTCQWQTAHGTRPRQNP